MTNTGEDSVSYRRILIAASDCARSFSWNGIRIMREYRFVEQSIQHAINNSSDIYIFFISFLHATNHRFWGKMNPHAYESDRATNRGKIIKLMKCAFRQNVCSIYRAPGSK